MMNRINEVKVTSFIEENRKLHKEFNDIVKECKADLWTYCRYVTDSPWDGEDLFQDTLLKAFGGFHQRFHPTNPKAYLFRVATTTWIDQCRRKQMFVGELKEEHAPREDFHDDLELKEVLTYLAKRFPPRQAALFFLKEVFSFTAEEVAGMIHTTAGAVYATVWRMKKKLRDSDFERDIQVNEHTKELDPIIKVYLEAINEGNVEGVLALLSETANTDAPLGFQEFSTDEMRSGSMKYGLPGFRAEPYMLWGREVIVVFHEGQCGPEIHDIQCQEIENGKIVYHRSFYFCKEFILAASEALGFAPQLEKPVVDW
ncbi:RNA polymerase sigma factor [Rossellomorea aquimaris]|uniref:RNA polymerase sigma factor n=1 Tax=Rossellomorea aquimaris TaxID=189382 RepID=UPI001CD27058|nr:RNA polymerase sigma factor [Rossellomorea aquimaris]MCA1053737.1 RNA polymerase sigma factor [Rossellomorea aquimaris]